MATPVLWQFRFSHFNEKVRWALDWKRLPHVRRSLLPGLHIPRVVWLTGQKQVPLLQLDGQTVADSTRIIAALERYRPDPPLYPGDGADRRRALELEDFFDVELGPHVRRAFFHVLLPETDYAAAAFAVGAGEWARRGYRAAFPVIRALMKADMRIDAAGAELGWIKVSAALDRLERELEPSGYLVGDRFSVADLAAAALLSPIVLPAEFPYQVPGARPPAVEAVRARFAGRPGVRWAAEMYRRHRGTSQEIPA
jgi:glutathione S-transferase